MTPSRADLAPLRLLALLTVAVLSAFTALALLAAAAQLREAQLVRLLRKDVGGRLSLDRVDQAEDLAHGATLGVIALLLLSLVLLLGLLLQAARTLRSPDRPPVRLSGRSVVVGLLIPVFGLFVLGRAMSDVWLLSGSARRRSRVLLAGLAGLVLAFVVVSVAARGKEDAIITVSGRQLLAVGLLLFAIEGLLAGAFAVGVLVRAERLTGTARPVSASTPVLRGLAAASLVLVVVGLGYGTPHAARVPAGLALTSEEEALPTGTAPTAAPTAAPRAFELRTPRFTIRLPARPERDIERAPVDGGTAVISTWTVTSGLNDLAVVDAVYPFELDGPKAAITTVNETAKSIGGKVSSLTRGTIGGHAYAQAVVTDAEGHRLGVRVVALPRATVSVLVQPVSDLRGLIATLVLR